MEGCENHGPLLGTLKNGKETGNYYIIIGYILGLVRRKGIFDIGVAILTTPPYEGDGRL